MYGGRKFQVLQSRLRLRDDGGVHVIKPINLYLYVKILVYTVQFLKNGAKCICSVSSYSLHNKLGIIVGVGRVVRWCREALSAGALYQSG